MILLALALALAAQQAPPAAPANTGPDKSEELAKQLRRFAMIYGAVEENYADPVDASVVYRAAIPGMLSRLDPYTVFFDPDQFHQLQQQQQSKVEGFGTIVSVLPGRVVVIEAHMGAPAAKAGIQPGDEILEVNGYRIDRLNTDQLMELLGEAKRSRAQVRLMRPGSAALETMILTPAEVQEHPVDRAYFIEPGIGYVRLTGFEQASADEVHAAIDGLLKQGMKSLVFDMRDNHGGLVDSAVEIAGFFLKPGEVVLSARGRAKKDEVFKVAAEAHPWDFPLAVLVNKNTASAAEILSGALQDHHRAKIIGQQTYGKGIVQSVYNLANGTGLALAAAQYFTPAGQVIQKRTPSLAFTNSQKGPGGITPDEVVSANAALNDWVIYLENANAFLDFARLYVQAHHDVTEKFEVSNDMLDEFRAWLLAQHASMNEELWTGNRIYLKQRLKVEIFNLQFGVAKGDQIAAAGDPVVQAALATLK